MCIRDRLKRKVIAVIIITLRNYNDIHSDIGEYKGIYNADADSFVFNFEKTRCV